MDIVKVVKASHKGVGTRNKCSAKFWKGYGRNVAARWGGRERERERQRDIETERQRDRETERQRERERARQGVPTILLSYF